MNPFIKEAERRHSQLISDFKKLTKYFSGSLHLVRFLGSDPEFFDSGSASNPIHKFESDVFLRSFLGSFKSACIRLAQQHYEKYSGYLAFGHLNSSITMFPDPNLVLWSIDRKGRDSRELL